MDLVAQSRVPDPLAGDTIDATSRTSGRGQNGMAGRSNWVATAMSTTFQDFNRSLIDDLRSHGGSATSGPFLGRDLLILTTKGAKSGAVRENPLVFSRDGEKYVIIASKGGAPTNPSWFHNLVVHPEVTFEVHGEKINARAHLAEDSDYERLYQNHAKSMPAFNEYRQKTSRKIPVVILERLDSK